MMYKKRELEIDFVFTSGGELTPTAKAIQDIMRLRSYAVSYVKKTNDLIDSRLRYMYVSSDLEEVVFVSHFDRSVIVVLTNDDNGLHIKFVPNENNIEPGIVGYRFRDQESE